MMNTSADLLKELRIDRQPPAAASRPRRRLWLVLAVGLLLALLALASAAWTLLGAPPPPEVRTATVLALGTGNAISSVLDASGYVVARRMATVSAKITGKVREVMIEEGMRVEQGQVMATLDPIDADAQLRLADSQLAAAYSQVDNVRAQLSSATADARRKQALVAQKMVSNSDYDNAVSSRDALRAQLQNAERNVKVYEQQRAIARIDLDNTIVRAPFSGVVTAKAAQPGEIVSPLATGGYTRTGIGTLVDMDSLEIEVEVGESFIGRVQPKMAVQAILNAYPEWKIPGEVIAIIPTADRGKATVKVRVALRAKDPRIVPEMGVRVSFMEPAQPQQPRRPQGVRVPAIALVQRDGGPRAFVLTDGDRVALRTVQAGIDMGSDKQVLKGLSAGDTVVLDPPQTLHDGDKVTLGAAD